ncbi:MAG: hypothetical protein AAGK05_02780 [Pseudomonadota bacterium]
MTFDIPYKLHSTALNEVAEIPNDYKFTLSFFPKIGPVKVSSKTPLHAKHLRHHNSFTLYSFDDITRRMLKMPKYVVFETKYPGVSQRVTNFNSQIHNFYYPNYLKKITHRQLQYLKEHPPKITLYYNQLRKCLRVPDLTTEKTVQINLPDKEPLSEMLKALNKDALGKGFAFTYLNEKIALMTFPTHFVKMSSSLALKLGFENAADVLFHDRTVGADHSPLFHKEIHDLYIYTNIIDPIYVGNVRAPLLLACPFKKDSELSYLTHIQVQNPSYQKLNRNVIREIDISIHDAYGKLLKFKSSRTVINLHFRKT